MRSFFYKTIKNLTFIYIICFFVLTYRLSYNEFYYDIHEDIQTSGLSQKEVYPCGEIIGIYTESNGIYVIDTCEIESLDGVFLNPAGHILRSGDYIIAINGQKMESKEAMIATIKESNGEEMAVSINRNGENRVEYLTPIKSKSGEYMLGVWIRDDLAGVGTITYIDTEGKFAALGHGMGDGETKSLIEVKNGDIYNSNIVGIQKGEAGIPGEVKGIIKYGLNNHIGCVETNEKEGIFGFVDEDDKEKYLSNKLYKIGVKQEAEVGAAQIVSEISGERRFYDIEITYVDFLAVNSNKGLHIQIVDEELIELTGGIVQGMSGSPIIQNEKVIGAITHVLISDPSKGYGIFVEDMIERSN